MVRQIVIDFAIHSIERTEFSTLGHVEKTFVDFYLILEMPEATHSYTIHVILFQNELQPFPFTLRRISYNPNNKSLHFFTTKDGGLSPRTFTYVSEA